MAVVQLSDVVVPEFYATYGGFDSMTSTALYQSGILQQNPLLDAQVNRGTLKCRSPFGQVLVAIQNR